MAYPGKGLGFQAVSAEPGAIVYRRRDLIGYLTGRLVPPGTLDDDGAVDFHKSQIDCRDEGNNFRLLNHACPRYAVARLKIKRVSGRYRLAVIAQKDIRNGVEITILYDEEGMQAYKCGVC